jgi:hypothetical protein
VPTNCGRPTLWPWRWATSRRVIDSPDGLRKRVFSRCSSGSVRSAIGCVEIDLRQVVVGVGGQDGHAALERHQPVVLVLLLARLGLARPMTGWAPNRILQSSGVRPSSAMRPLIVSK